MSQESAQEPFLDLSLLLSIWSKDAIFTDFKLGLVKLSFY